MRERERARLGRAPTPSAAIPDSQSVKTTEKGATAGQPVDGPPAGGLTQAQLRGDLRYRIEVTLATGIDAETTRARAVLSGPRVD